MSDIYARLKKVDIIPAILSNLDVLPSIEKRLGAIEGRFSKIENEIVEMKNDMKTVENKVIGTEMQTESTSQRMSFIEQERDMVRRENDELKERVLEMQSRSMRENLLFGGIPEEAQEKDDPDNIQTERVLKKFISEKMDIKDDIQFQVVHRLRPRSDGKPRTIVAKFERRKDRDRVLKAAPLHLKETQFSAHEQFPTEIIEQWNVLWPIFKREQKAGRSVRFKEDKLFVDGTRIYPQDVMQTQNSYPPGPGRSGDFRQPPNGGQGHPFLFKQFGPPANPNPIRQLHGFNG